MTKEIVELPDRKSGDINEIRDKKIALAKNATAQSDLPQQLEYLIKNGQTGEFMNVLDSYINEKIRSALGSLIASLDKGAAGTTKAIACIDTNNDLGIINPANLASVLGGLGTIPKCRIQSEENRIVMDSVDAGFNIIFRQTDGEVTASFLDGNGGAFTRILSNHFNWLGTLESASQLSNYDGSGFWSLVNNPDLGNGTIVCYGGAWPTHIFLQYDNGSVLLKMRIKVNGTWTDWARF